MPPNVEYVASTRTPAYVPSSFDVPVDVHRNATAEVTVGAVYALTEIEHDTVPDERPLLSVTDTENVYVPLSVIGDIVSVLPV